MMNCSASFWHHYCSFWLTRIPQSRYCRAKVGYTLSWSPVHCTATITHPCTHKFTHFSYQLQLKCDFCCLFLKTVSVTAFDSNWEEEPLVSYMPGLSISDLDFKPETMKTALVRTHRHIDTGYANSRGPLTLSVFFIHSLLYIQNRSTSLHVFGRNSVCMSIFN